MLAVVQHTGSYEATCMFVRNSEAAQLKSEINDGTYEHKFSFFLSFFFVCVCVCENITNMAAERNLRLCLPSIYLVEV